jgi:hypothetical protein
VINELTTHSLRREFANLRPNKSLDASGESVFHIMTDPAMVD